MAGSMQGAPGWVDGYLALRRKLTRKKAVCLLLPRFKISGQVIPRANRKSSGGVETTSYVTSHGLYTQRLCSFDEQYVRVSKTNSL